MKKTIEAPLINVRDLVVFPGTSVTLWIGREFTKEAIVRAQGHHRGKIFIFTQKKAEQNNIEKKSDMYSVGIECKIMDFVEFTDGTIKVRVEALQQIRLVNTFIKEEVRYASCNPIVQQKSVGLKEEERNELLRMLVRWNPNLALESEKFGFHDIRKQKNTKKFIGAIWKQLYLRESLEETFENIRAAKQKKMDLINSAVKVRQKILEEPNLKKQINLTKKMLKEETLLDLKR